MVAQLLSSSRSLMYPIRKSIGSPRYLSLLGTQSPSRTLFAPVFRGIRLLIGRFYAPLARASYPALKYTETCLQLVSLFVGSTSILAQCQQHPSNRRVPWACSARDQTLRPTTRSHNQTQAPCRFHLDTQLRWLCRSGREAPPYSVPTVPLPWASTASLPV